MKLSAQTHRKLEDFFRAYFREPELRLPSIEIYAGRAAHFITERLKIGGITVGRRIFIHPRHVFRDAAGRLCISKNLLAHEATHVVQYDKQGFFGFLLAYLNDYRRGLKTQGKFCAASRFAAYYQISQEIEAREAAAEFEKIEGAV